jgi:hypothetical protein
MSEPNNLAEQMAALIAVWRLTSVEARREFRRRVDLHGLGADEALTFKDRAAMREALARQMEH